MGEGSLNRVTRRVDEDVDGVAMTVLLVVFNG